MTDHETNLDDSRSRETKDHYMCNPKDVNSSGRPGARLMDLSAQMDPAATAAAAVDLNIRLMRWRLMPALEPEKVAAQRCLLIGAGTLGCAVARCLLGWGVKAITLVDSGGVLDSNRFF